MTKIDTDWLRSPATQGVLSLLTDAGHQAFVVGGAVRNALMERAVTDIDVATSAHPDAVIALAEQAGLRAVPTGIDHGTVTLIVDDTPFEVTTFRRDVETDGRHARVVFSDDLAGDAARRDFTINALYASANGEVTDPVGGLADLAHRRVVFVGDAETRIQEDYLRSLRFFRFTAEYGDPDAGIDADALAAIAGNLDGIDTLARERVGAEMIKLLGAPDPAPALAAMRSSGALLRVLPGAAPEVIAPLIHLEGVANIAPDPLRRLAALGGEDSAEHLRLSRRAARDLDALKKWISDSATPREISWRGGSEMAWSVVLVRHASLGMPLPESIGAEIERGASAKFPLEARDLMPGLSGPALGAALSAAERLWIDSDFALDRDALIHAVGKAG